MIESNKFKSKKVFLLIIIATIILNLIINYLIVSLKIVVLDEDPNIEPKYWIIALVLITVIIIPMIGSFIGLIAGLFPFKKQPYKIKFRRSSIMTIMILEGFMLWASIGKLMMNI